MLFLVHIALGFFAPAFASHQCSEMFSLSDIPAPLIKQADVLAPQYDFSAKTLEAAYLEVLALHNALAGSRENLPAEHERYLVKQFSDHYSMPGKPEDLKIFYTNALHSLYTRMAWEWKKQEIEAIAGSRLSRLSLQVAQSLMDSFFSIGGMGGTDLKTESIREVLQKREWKTYPWRDALVILKAWESSPEFSRGFFFFNRWYDRQSGLPELSRADMDRLYLAISGGYKKSSPVFCCKSSFACGTCPHNRKWLKED